MRRLLVTAGAVAAALGFGLADARALPKYSGKEKKTCVFCHVKAAGGKELNEAGKYYKAHGHSLKGYKGGKAAAGKGDKK